jgi:serine/threonine protein kinase
VPVHDFGEVDGAPYIVMELVNGPTLSHVLQEEGALDAQRVVNILSSILGVLAEAHSHGVLHRDLKPDNIVLEPAVQSNSPERARLLDFGVAKLLPRDDSGPEPSQLTKEGRVVGTPYYMSPEQVLGDDVDHRSDLYSLGVTLFELATGVVPFCNGEVGYHHRHSPVPDPQSIRADLPDGLSQLILKLLEKDPNDRHQSATEVLENLFSIDPG